MQGKTKEKVLSSLGPQAGAALWFGDRNLLQQEPQDLTICAHQEPMSEVGAANSSLC